MYKIGIYSAAKKPLLKSFDEKWRIKWCKERKNWIIEQWKKVEKLM